MRFKTKNDINFLKFYEVSNNLTEDYSANEILEEAYKAFKPKNINRFAAALEKEGRLKRKFKLNLKLKAGEFIDADTYRSTGDLEKMFEVILKPKKRFLFWKYNIKNHLSLREAEFILNKWNEFLKETKEKYEYIYNPPSRISNGKTTQGSIERQQFAEHYGGYAEMTYLVGNSDVVKFKEVWNLELDYFLFWGEYLLRKKDIENID